MRRVHKEAAAVSAPPHADDFGGWDDHEEKKKAAKPHTPSNLGVTALDVDSATEALLPSSVGRQSNFCVRITACFCAWTVCLPMRLCKSKKGAVVLVLIIASIIGTYVWTQVPICSCGCVEKMPLGPMNTPWTWGKTGGGNDVLVWDAISVPEESSADALTGESSGGFWNWLSSVFSTKPPKEEKKAPKAAGPRPDRMVLRPAQLRRKCGSEFWKVYPLQPAPQECPTSYNQERKEVKRVCTRDCESLCRLTGGMWIDGPEE